MSLYNIFILVVVRLSTRVIAFLSLGSGSTWPGHIALKLNPHFVRDMMNSSRTKVVLIAGTNGKTTTSTLIRTILEKNGKSVFQNEEGANLLNGIASSLIKNVTSNMKIDKDYAIFEVDENTLPQVLDQITPDAVIILNLFRDQLDRYGEVNTIAKHWQEEFKKLPEKVQLILNGDDPQISYLGTECTATVHYFGVEDSVMEQKEIPHDVDSVYCPRCGEKLQYEKMSYSHLGIFNCPACGFKREKTTTYSVSNLSSVLKGVYNYYNITAAFLTLETLLKLPLSSMVSVSKEFKPAFGRQEHILYKNRDIFLLLSKNPTGFNQSIEAVKELLHGKKQPFLVLLNDRIPDGKDISWIWDVEFQHILPLASNIVVSGDRAFDMALRFKYCLERDEPVVKKDEEVSFDICTVISSLPDALEAAVLAGSDSDTVVVLATYSAMLDVRKLLVGKKLL